jgi:hypothetical protein
MPICGVSLTLRHCGVQISTPHSSGFRGPCIWTFLINLYFSYLIIFAFFDKRRTVNDERHFFMSSFEPKIIALVCTYCTYTAADMAGSMRLQYPSFVRIVKYLCTGNIDIQHILKGFEKGADAILVGG